MKVERPMADYNVKLSQFHQRVWQDELEAPGTIDENGWIQFGPTSLGELTIYLRETSPEQFEFSVRFFSDQTRSHEDILRICNAVNDYEDAKLSMSSAGEFCFVKASILLILAEHRRIPDEELLRAVIGPAISMIKAAEDMFTSELQKLDSEAGGTG